MSTRASGNIWAIPNPLDLGEVSENDTIEGVFKIANATQLLEQRVVHGAERLVIAETHCHRTGLHCQFKIDTRQSGSLHQVLSVRTDLGTALVEVHGTVVPAAGRGGRLLLCSSPYMPDVTQACRSNLALVVQELQLQVSTAAALPLDTLTSYDVIVLHDAGILRLEREASLALTGAMESGTRVVLLANAFLRGSVASANRLLGNWGLRIEDREYDLVNCQKASIHTHQVTDGVSRIHWRRPSPVIVPSRDLIIINHPSDEEDGLAAYFGPGGNGVVIGASLLESLLCVGYPFDNGRLFANLVRHQRRTDGGG